MSYMHESVPYGHMTIEGIPPDDRGLAALVSRPLGEVKRALAELEARGVFSRTDDGVIYSRRMVRDANKAERDELNGKSGGSPLLTTSTRRGVNPHTNPPLKAQKPEAREPEARSQTSSDTTSENITQIRAVADATRPRAPDRFEEFWEVYPKRDGANPKIPARKKFIAAVKSGVEPAAVIAAAGRYAAEMRAKAQERTPYVAQAVTWLNQQRWGDYDANAPNAPGVISAEESAQLFAELRRKDSHEPATKAA